MFSRIVIAIPLSSSATLDFLLIFEADNLVLFLSEQQSNDYFLFPFYPFST